MSIAAYLPKNRREMIHIDNWTLRTQDTSDPKHFGPCRSEVSRDISDPGPKCLPRHLVSRDISVPGPKCPDTSDPLFRSEMSWVRSVLGPKCPVSDTSDDRLTIKLCEKPGDGTIAYAR